MTHPVDAKKRFADKNKSLDDEFITQQLPQMVWIRRTAHSDFFTSVVHPHVAEAEDFMTKASHCSAARRLS